MLQLILRASCALSLLILMLAPQTGHAQQTETDWYKRAAPEKCLGYIAWNNEPEKPIEGNATQALMAEPEVRAFIDDLRLRAGLMAPAVMSDQIPKEKLELLHALSPKLVASIFERSGCMFVEEVKLARNMEEPPMVEAAMLVDLKSEADQFISQMVEMVSSEDKPASKVDLAGATAYQVELSDSEEALYFGNAGEILVIAIGKQAYTGAIQRMKGTSQPDWLTQLDQRAQALDHVHSIAFLNMKSVLRSVAKANGPNANVVAELLGVSNVKQVQMLSGLDGEGSVTHVLFEAAELEGVLGLLTKSPIKESLFKNIPADSLGAVAMTLDNEGLLDLIRTMETMMGQGAGYAQFKQELLDNTEVDLEEDIIESLGDSWTLFNGASDGWVTGMTLIGDVKDSKTLTSAIERFFTAVGEKVKDDPFGYRPGFFKQAYAGQTIYSMTFPRFFLEVSFGIKDDQIYIGMFPQAVMTAIKGLPADQILMDATQVGKLGESKFLEGPTKLTGLAYADAKLQAQMTYPYLQVVKTVGATMSAGQISPDMVALLSGVEFPPARTVIRKIKPTLVLVRTSEQGIEIEARQTIPSNSAVLGVPVAVGMLLPAVAQVREAAREVQSMNNLKMMALASLNHESAHMRYPTDGPEDGEDHAFSWRVHILPYIEANNTYDQIRFDEPWNSDHNKAVLAETPEFFKSPTRDLAEGMTVYRGFKGEAGSRGVLGGSDGDGTRIGSITDGTSNTILIAEVPDEMAVHWAQPTCLDVNEEVAKQLLKSEGTMLTAFCDGSTHRFPTTIGTDALLTFLGCDDGEINPDVFDQNVPQRRVQDRNREADPRFILPGKKERF